MTFFLWVITSMVRWIRLKIYQYEVTFAVYMLTPTEKFIFNSLILTLLSMIATGIYVYLPNHLRVIYSHLYYYWVGERPFISANLPSISSVFREGGSVMYETAKNAAVTATPIAEL
ncbi:hypothetical protein BO70DRAFT_116783 [Aspergillus heteromorphus CBS 117.55]|uniref:Small subunit of serine palmitoyltransferase-like protein n=1 Tax=Aspergillus heteromorphus CBS 117.55 TaxID=1448321 RepID=A0A317VFX8_9EURO|nr:uncharacterized protein BO70DRAFT_116783 [Aspergillus heteromorphus CBS 117.55]PWY72349.1 hypothetical protein BO70DRAFT_116783 [Aspergillus heteromorphus CBS 117.55]